MGKKEEKSEGFIVYETYDYSIFKKLEENRDVTSVQKIIISIRKIGYIPCPICCNEKMEIVDGQNRFEALRKLGLPIQYYIVPGIGINEAIQMNLGRTNWKPIDYVKSYACQGNLNYKRLLDLMNESDFMSLQEIAGITQNSIIEGGTNLNTIKAGKLVISNELFEEKKKIIKKLNKYKSQFKQIVGSRRTLITGISWILSVEGVNQKRIEDIIVNKYPLIKPVVTSEHLLANISEIYNKGLAKEQRLYFETIYKQTL